MMSCSTSFSVMSCFKNKREIRQGEPLSPILFEMTMDILTRLIEKEIGGKRIDTYQVNGATSITHLKYDNDVLIFSKANQKSLEAIKKILVHFPNSHVWKWTQLRALPPFPRYVRRILTYITVEFIVHAFRSYNL